VDLADSESVIAFIGVIKKKFGARLRVLVNSAGVITSPQNTRDGMRYMFQVNVWAPFFLTKQLHPLLQSNGPSSVVNVASDAQFPAFLLPQHWQGSGLGTAGNNSQIVYSVNKEEVRLLTWEAARRFNTSGVFVNAVHPGFTLATSHMLKDASWCDYNSNFDSTSHCVTMAPWFPWTVPPSAKLSLLWFVSAMLEAPSFGLFIAKNCCDSPERAAARSIWLALNAPALNLSATWWKMTTFPLQLSRYSVQAPFTQNIELQQQLWDYCDSLV